MVKAILTDIEGTTTSLAFVKDVLFPYARAHMASYVREHAHVPEVATQLQLVSAEVGGELSIEACISQLCQWIDDDKKVTSLKALQGMIWQAGYQNGDYTGHLYEDAYAYLKKWHEAGIKLYVFSSGSVYAQKLLFAHTQFGDLTSFFSGYFDTNVGDKRSPVAYQSIAQQMACPAQDIVFLSDIKEELDAAKQAAMQTYWLVREGQTSASAAHQQVDNFCSIAVL